MTAKSLLAEVKASPIVVKLILFLGFALHMLGAWLVPISTDEAYYFAWGKSPGLGYLDHPPFVAWLMAPGAGLDSIFWARLPAVFMALLSGCFLLGMMRKGLGLGVRSQASALALYSFSILGGIYGVIVTPDIPMLFFWSLALYEATMALTHHRWRWLTAGLAVGLGMLGKYPMLLILPVFFLVMIRDRRHWASPFPYLGFALAVLVFLPNVSWNQSQDWLSYRFQLSRGLAHSHHIKGAFDSPLPAIEDTVYDAAGFALSQELWPQTKPKELNLPKTAWQRFKRRVSDYWGGQLGVWGLLLLPLGAGLLRGQRGHREQVLVPSVRHLLQWSVLVPLASFGAVALVQKVETNWPAAYMFGAAVLLAPYAARVPRLLVGASAMQVGLLGVVFVIAAQPQILESSPHNRLLQETHGFKGLAAQVDPGGPVPRVFADTYQLTAMLRYYLPETQISQWPGLTRHSEFTRDPMQTKGGIRELRQEAGFRLVTTKLLPPYISGFKVAAMQRVKDCLTGISVQRAGKSASQDCRQSPHVWYIFDYVSDNRAP